MYKNKHCEAVKLLNDALEILLINKIIQRWTLWCALDNNKESGSDLNRRDWSKGAMEFDNTLIDILPKQYNIYVPVLVILQTKPLRTLGL